MPSLINGICNGIDFVYLGRKEKDEYIHIWNRVDS